jgi:3-mercaptopyruvate sulfurtransferase SseA
MSWHTGRACWRSVLVSLVLVTVPAQHGCAVPGAYDDARGKAAASSVLVSPATLDGWITQGYGTDAFGYHKLVVLDVSAAGGYAAGHIPGAFHLDTATDLMVSRSEGIGGTYAYTDTNGVTYTELNVPAEVASSEMMNALFRRTGIDRNTVVALAADTMLNAGIAYFNFRYWGFPKQRIRVLDRTKAAWVTAGHSLDTATPSSPSPSTYGVCDLIQNTSFRATLADMIQVAKGAVPRAIAWDVRTANEFNGVAGATAGPFSGKPGYAKKVAFEGHVQGAVNLVYTALLTDANSTLLDVDTIKATLSANGITPDVRTHVYCRTGPRGTVGFLILDGVLGYPASLYDGSWMEWGQMATTLKGGALADGSQWRTDTAELTASITYAVDNALTVDSIVGANSSSLRADLVNVTDSSVCGGGRPGEGRPIAPGY